MTNYALEAQAYWRRWLPRTHANLTDPDFFYQQLGEDVQDRVIVVWDALTAIHLTPDITDHSKRAGLLRLLRREAEHTVIQALVQLPPEADTARPGTEPAAHQTRLSEFDSRLAQQQATIRDLLEGDRSVSETSDTELTQALQLMPELLAALGTSLDELRALGREI
ncbi:hypothetical protein [Streptomyces sp. S1D4-20]|uniref:hypothetical protein n=1 Tax=Streptomyces sp. S1D4-20 TaxID=2594462 RepID=UPI0011626FE3|nr:hypothetical protein [Streptomyces sp. S1D4-20]QDN54266.1 hypothetical protein FNV67_01495 [Streptomyces sp. S1D4-20]